MGLVFHLRQQPKLPITLHAQVLLDDRCSVFRSHSLVEQIHPCLKLKCLKKNLVKSQMDEKYDGTVLSVGTDYIYSGATYFLSKLLR